MAEVGATARRTRAVTEHDIELFTQLMGDRNPLHYDRKRRAVPLRWADRPGREDAVAWKWAFAFLVPGPALGIVAMLRLRRLEAS